MDRRTKHRVVARFHLLEKSILSVLLWCLEYLIKPDVDYSHRIVMEMDDWGTSDQGFLSYWRYPIPDEQTIRRMLIGPLRKHKAVAVANVITECRPEDTAHRFSLDSTIHGPIWSLARLHIDAAGAEGSCPGRSPGNTKSWLDPHAARPGLLRVRGGPGT